MCGIVGYIGHRNASELIIKGLKRLEYRGYDSAGIALFNEPEVKVTKIKGKVSDLEIKINQEKNNSGSIIFEYKDLEQLNKIIDIIKNNY